jgi:DNA primase
MVNNFIKQCNSNLVNDKPSDAIDYLTSRQVNEESIITHQIGYCYPDQELPDAIKYFGREYDSNTDSGYSYFIQDKLILPICGEFGDVPGFATRTPSHESGNTWWNAPNPFKKGNHLFLLNKSRQQIFKENKVYVVEGYMDAIIAFQSGLKNVVALMGTALTSRKIGLIARYCDNICLALDVDENEAGQKATAKSIYIINEFNLFKSISVVDIPVKSDPASFLMKHELNEFLELERVMTEKDIFTICKKMRKGK